MWTVWKKGSGSLFHSAECKASWLLSVLLREDEALCFCGTASTKQPLFVGNRNLRSKRKCGFGGKTVPVGHFLVMLQQNLIIPTVHMYTGAHALFFTSLWIAKRNKTLCWKSLQVALKEKGFLCFYGYDDFIVLHPRLKGSSSLSWAACSSVCWGVHYVYYVKGFHWQA